MTCSHLIVPGVESAKPAITYLFPRCGDRALTIAVDDATDKTCVDGLPIAFLLDQLEDSVGHLLVEWLEQAVSPRDQRKLGTQTRTPQIISTIYARLESNSHTLQSFKMILFQC